MIHWLTDYHRDALFPLPFWTSFALYYTGCTEAVTSCSDKINGKKHEYTVYVNQWLML
jgi:hypothetical protein